MRRGDEALEFKEEPEQSELRMDFCFPEEETIDKKLTVLVVRERRTRMTTSTVAPSKSNGELMAKRAVVFTREIGVNKGGGITAESDQEPAMLATLSEIARHRAAEGGGRLVP